MNMHNKLMLAALALLSSLTMHHALAEEVPAQALTPAPVMEEKPIPAKSESVLPPNQPATSQPARDNHTDYRYCLDFKTNKEIIECRYKK